MAEKNGRNRDAPPAPTAGEVWALYRNQLNDGNEGRLRALVEQFRALTRMTHTVKIPEAYRATTREVRTPFVRDAWLRTTAALSRKDWIVHIEPKSPSRSAQRATGVAERWVKSATDRMNKECGENVPYEATKALVRDAEAVIKTVHRPDAWANFPRRVDEDAETYLAKTTTYKKGSPLPFAWRHVDRLQMVFGDGEFGDDWVIEFGEYSKPFLRNRYGMVDDPASDRLVNPQAKLEGRSWPEGYAVTTSGQSVKLEYFDADWWCVVIDGDMAPEFPKPNPYAPRLPYARARADAEPEPILYSLLYLVPALDAILTAWTNWMWLGMFPTPLLSDVPNSSALPSGLRPPLGEDNQEAQFEWVQGKLLEVPRGKQFSFMQAPPVGADAKEMSLILRSLIDIAGIPSILRGSSMTGDSGYLANQMLAAAMMMYGRAADALQRQLETAVEFFFYLIPARIKQTVYVMGASGEGSRGFLGLRPEGDSTDWLASVDQLGDVTVERRPDTSAMQQAQAMIAKQLTEGPPDQRLLSRRRALEEHLGEEDPDAIADEIWVEYQIAHNPVLNDRIVQSALAEARFFVPPTGQNNPATQLVGPDGMPIASPPGPPGIPGQVAGGLPVMPGAGMPMQPPAPQPPAGAGGPGGRPAGAYPGRPSTPVQQVGP